MRLAVMYCASTVRNSDNKKLAVKNCAHETWL